MFSYPTARAQQSSVPNGVAEHNVTVARAFTKLMGAFVTFWDNDAGSKIHLLANPGQAHRRGQAGQPPGVSDAAGQPAVPSQPHEGSLGALPLPLRPRGHLRPTGRGNYPSADHFIRGTFLEDHGHGGGPLQ